MGSSMWKKDLKGDWILILLHLNSRFSLMYTMIFLRKLQNLELRGEYGLAECEKCMERRTLLPGDSERTVKPRESA